MSKIATGIDVGTHHVKVVIAEQASDRKQPPRVLGTGYAQSVGLRRGYIVSAEEASRAIRAAVAQAQNAARLKVKNAYLAVGGEGLDEAFARGEVIVERGDSEVTERDLTKARLQCEHSLPPAQTLNRRVLHNIPLSWSLDGSRVLGKNPAGMKGTRVAVDSLFITAPTRHIDELTEAVEGADIGVEDFIASPLAASFVTLTKTQRRVGCVLVNVGAETLSIAVFEEDGPVSVKVFPTGANDIANDLALGLKIPLEEAEQLKMGAVLGAPFPRKKIDDIINRRLTATFKLVEAHLKKIGRDELLPAGAIITGGGANLANVCDVAQSALRLPCRPGALAAGDTGKAQLQGGSWAVAYGLTLWALDRRDSEPHEAGSFSGAFTDTFGGAWKVMKKFLP